jgi:hypothetical protein
MAYSAEISRANPALFVILIDQSTSMGDGVPGSDQPNRQKSVALAAAINRLFYNLIIRCQKEEGVRHFFDICVLGYGNTVGPAFIGPLAGRELVSITELADSPARIETRVKKSDDGAGGIVEQSIDFPVWFEPVANGRTPMCEALTRAHGVISQWLAQHPACFPPVVIHITDGESTDGNPVSAMKQLTSLASRDGNVLLFNVHISSNALETPIAFPSSGEVFSSESNAQQLFEGSSLLLPAMRAVANAQHGMSLSEGARGYVFNGDMILVIQALDIGTRPSNLR